MSLGLLSPPQLLAHHAAIGDELRRRGVTRSANNPAGDYAEYLFCLAFAWVQAGNSVKSYDAIDQNTGSRYQIKSRRLTEVNTSRQVSALRGLDGDCFDFLAGLLFNRDFSVLRAAIIPHRIVLANAKYGGHTNSWRFFLRDGLWTETGVIDVTARLQEVAG